MAFELQVQSTDGSLSRGACLERAPPSSSQLLPNIINQSVSAPVIGTLERRPVVLSFSIFVSVCRSV